MISQFYLRVLIPFPYKPYPVNPKAVDGKLFKNDSGRAISLKKGNPQVSSLTGNSLQDIKMGA